MLQAHWNSFLCECVIHRKKKTKELVSEFQVSDEQGMFFEQCVLKSACFNVRGFILSLTE